MYRGEEEDSYVNSISPKGLAGQNMVKFIDSQHDIRHKMYKQIVKRNLLLELYTQGVLQFKSYSDFCLRSSAFFERIVHRGVTCAR